MFDNNQCFTFRAHVNFATDVSVFVAKRRNKQERLLSAKIFGCITLLEQLTVAAPYPAWNTSCEH
jgi:hypothetical protein